MRSEFRNAPVALNDDGKKFLEYFSMRRIRFILERSGKSDQLCARHSVSRELARKRVSAQDGDSLSK